MGYNSVGVIIPKDRENDPFEYVKELSKLRSSDEFRDKEVNGKLIYMGEPGSLQIGGAWAGQFVGKTPRDNPNNVMEECYRCDGTGKIDLEEYLKGAEKFWMEIAEEKAANPNTEFTKEQWIQAAEEKIEKIKQNATDKCPQCGGYGNILKYWTDLESEDPNDDLQRIETLLDKIESDEYSIIFGEIITPENKVYGYNATFNQLHSAWVNGEIERDDIGIIAWDRVKYILRQYKDHLIVNTTGHE